MFGRMSDRARATHKKRTSDTAPIRSNICVNISNRWKMIFINIRAEKRSALDGKFVQNIMFKICLNIFTWLDQFEWIGRHFNAQRIRFLLKHILNRIESHRNSFNHFDRIIFIQPILFNTHFRSEIKSFEFTFHKRLGSCVKIRR